LAACPPVEAGPGRLITGTFAHRQGQVWELRLVGSGEVLGMTATHPVWSDDRNAWVPAGELRAGERLLAVDGSTPQVESFRLRPEPEPVYNLEVEGDHCYRVGQQGLLVHNASEITGSPDPECNPDCDFDLPLFPTPMMVGEVRPLPGRNPNGLRVEKVRHRTSRLGVYLNIHVQKGKIKIGSTGNFASRYPDTAPAGNTKYQGGCRIRYEIVITTVTAYAQPEPNCPKTWSARRQRQHDEEYVQRLVPNAMKYQAEEEAQNAVDYDCWVRCRHVFGYATVAPEFGSFLAVGTAPGGDSQGECKASR
jgi:hypothetical protein